MDQNRGFRWTNAGKNNVHTPTVPTGTRTFHRDGQIFLNEKDKYTVAFYIQGPGESGFTIQDDYSVRVGSGYAESKLSRPATAGKTVDGIAYKFDGWYKGEACTQAASFDGTWTYDGKSHAATVSVKAEKLGYVTLEAAPVTIEITPRTVTLRSEDATKAYDGTPLTKATYSLEGTLAAGDEIKEVTVAGTITDVGSADNKIVSYTILHDGTLNVTGSYSNVVKVDGTLTVNKRALTLTYTVEGSRTKVGSSANCVTEVIIMNGEVLQM